MFTRSDANGDGVISYDEMREPFKQAQQNEKRHDPSTPIPDFEVSPPAPPVVASRTDRARERDARRGSHRSCRTRRSLASTPTQTA